MKDTIVISIISDRVIVKKPILNKSTNFLNNFVY